MAINLFSLDKKEATLTKLNNQNTIYKIDKNKIKEDFQKIKSENKLNQNSTLVIGDKNISFSENIQNLGELNTNYCNYSFDVFFCKNMPKESASGGYMVGGVDFCKEDFEKCRMVMKSAMDSFGCGIGKNVNIDYKNYAQMSIAVGKVKSFASQNLTTEQANVLNNAIEAYNNALIDLEKKTFENGNYVNSPYEGISEYYGKAYVLSDGEIDAINDLKKEFEEITGKAYELTQKGMVSGVQSATNEKLINSISDLFLNVDYNDESSIDEAFEKYKELVKPAYIAYGMSDSYGSLFKALNKDVEGFRTQILNMSMAMKYHSSDYSI